LTALGRKLGWLDTPENVIASTDAARRQAYAAADRFEFHPDDVNPAYQGALDGLTEGQTRNLSPAMKAKVDAHMGANDQMGSVTAGDMDEFARDLHGAATTPADKVIAARIKNNLNDVMESAAPVSGQAPGAALVAITNARAAYQRAANASALAQWDPLSDFPANAGPEVKNLATSFYQKGSPEYKALKNIYDATGGYGQTAYNVMHMIDPALEYAGATVAGGPGALGAGVVGHAVKPGIGRALGWLADQKLQREIQASYPALTGARTAVTPSTGDLLRSLAIGGTAGAQ
jgi:hypothetical protein